MTNNEFPQDLSLPGEMLLQPQMGLQGSGKIYGRDSEKKKILDLFDKAKSGSVEMLLLRGRAGVGKSTLVYNTFAGINHDKMTFLYGKFDPCVRNIPYHGFIQAFQNFITGILMEGESTRSYWKELILRSLKGNGRIITNIIPELEDIIGPQPKLPELGPIENQNRFRIHFQRFFNLFPKKNCPLVLFIDDIHWTDLAGLSLLNNLIGNSLVHSLLFIGAFREEEVDKSHPLTLALEEWNQSNLKITEMDLNPLNQEDITEFIRDSIDCSEKLIESISGVIHSKTKGNPYYIAEYIGLLSGEGFFDKKTATKDRELLIEKIPEINSENSVRDIINLRIMRLSIEALGLLKLCTCLGNNLREEVLIKLNDSRREHTLLLIEEIINARLMFFLNDELSFVHDKIQECVFSLIPEGEMKRIRYHIGTTLLAEKSDSFSRELFDILDHLNSSTDFFVNIDARFRLAELNLSAGKNAKLNSAHNSALKYLEKGIELVKEECWESNYPLALELYSHAAEAAFLAASFEKMNIFCSEVFLKARHLLDKIPVIETTILALYSQNRLTEAIDYALKVMKELKVPLPQKPGMLHVAFELIKTRTILIGKSVEHFKKLPVMTDPYILAAFHIMMIMATAVYHSEPNIAPIMAFKALQLVLKYGNSVNASYFYAAFGLVLCGFLGEIQLGYDFGRHAVSLHGKQNAPAIEVKTELLFNLFLVPWRHPLKSSLSSFERVYERGLETGDLEYATLGAVSYCETQLYMGENLQFSKQKCDYYQKAFVQLNQDRNLLNLKIVNRFLTFFTSINISKKEEMEEEQLFIEQLKISKDQSLSGNLYIYKCVISCIYNNYKEAETALYEGEKYEFALGGLFIIPFFFFYKALVFAALYEEAERNTKRRMVKKIRKILRKFKKWSTFAPENFLHKYYLIMAEYYRIQGKIVKSMECFDKSISLASENQFLHEEAIANERAGIFYLNIHRQKIGEQYLKEAYNCYYRWGAKPKLLQLSEKYPHISFS